MADLEREVLDELVRLMNGELDYDELDDERLFQLVEVSRRGRQTLHEVVLKLRDRGYTFGQIGDRAGVTESAASRWAQPPRQWGRPKQQRDEDDGEQA